MSSIRHFRQLEVYQLATDVAMQLFEQNTSATIDE
jgi:hypothetical protein